MDIKLVSENVMIYRLLIVSNVSMICVEINMCYTYLITETNSTGRQYLIQENIVNIISSSISLNVLSYDMMH